MTHSDQLLERLYDLADRQSTERTRAEVARAALVAAQYRAAQLSNKRKDTTTHEKH